MLQIIIKSGVSARRKILSGAIKVGEIVGMSLGPFGRNAIIKTKYSPPQILNDGVTIARNIMLDDDIEDLGAQTLIEGSMKTDDRAGDGTTTTVILASKIVEEYVKRIEEEDSSHSGLGTIGEGNIGVANVNKMAREILDTGKIVIEQLKKMSRPMKKQDLKNVISSSLGVLVPEFVDSLAEIVSAVGKDGHISVDDNWHTKYGIETELIEGMKFLGTYATSYMINTKRKESIQEDVGILICNHDIATTKQMETLLKEVVQKGVRKLVIIANKFETPFVKLMASTVNMARQGDVRLIDYLCVKTPSLTTERFEDIAIFCGAKFYDKNRLDIDLSKADMTGLGFIKKIIVNEDEVNLIGGAGTEQIKLKNKDKDIGSFLSPVENRVDLLKKQIQIRIGSLKSGMGVIRVGAVTEGERVLVKRKIEDSIHSAQNALEEGVLPGGGLALKEIAEKLGEKHPMYFPLRAPYDKIQEGAGGELKIPETVIDPLKVTRIIVETACSIASSLITVEVGIAERRKTLMDELDKKLYPQNDVGDDFR